MSELARRLSEGAEQARAFAAAYRRPLLAAVGLAALYLTTLTPTHADGESRRIFIPVAHGKITIPTPFPRPLTPLYLAVDQGPFYDPSSPPDAQRPLPNMRQLTWLNPGTRTEIEYGHLFTGFNVRISLGDRDPLSLNCAALRPTEVCVDNRRPDYYHAGTQGPGEPFEELGTNALPFEVIPGMNYRAAVQTVGGTSSPVAEIRYEALPTPQQPVGGARR